MFWDKLKPAAAEPKAAAVDVAPDAAIVVTWDDAKVSRVGSRDLRVACPCASCVDEWTGEKLVDEGRIPADVRPVGMSPVGNYALQIKWSDGHDTGLYTWRQLRTYAAT